MHNTPRQRRTCQVPVLSVFHSAAPGHSPRHPGFPCRQSFLLWNLSSVHWTGHWRGTQEMGQGGKVSATRMLCWKEPCYKAHVQTRPLWLIYTCLHVLLNQELWIQFYIALYSGPTYWLPQEPQNQNLMKDTRRIKINWGAGGGILWRFVPDRNQNVLEWLWESFILFRFSN